MFGLLDEIQMVLASQLRFSFSAIMSGESHLVTKSTIPSVSFLCFLAIMFVCLRTKELNFVEQSAAANQSANPPMVLPQNLP
jgi:hypothetical protein